MLKRRLRKYDINDIKHPEDSEILDGLNKIPFLAPTPLPTIMATGVARPNAQGQLITSTEIPLASA